MLLFLPWHYLRGRLKFWLFLLISFVGVVVSLFGSPTLLSVGSLNLTVAGVLVLAYPVYFLIDLVRWLMISDADRALNIVLREQGGR